MKKVILVVVLVCMYAFAKAESYTATLMQSFVSHQVAANETVYSIAKKYGVTEKQIIKLNPDAKDRVYEGLVLVLPSTANATQKVSPEQQDIRFKTHKVRRKETLFSISKKYDVAQDIIKKFNKQLYSKPLRKGDKIRIPLNYRGTVTVATDTPSGGNVTQVDTPKNGTVSGAHLVKAKETKYGVARMYGITIAQLETLNPGMGKGLQEGATIKVPVKAIGNTATIDEAKYAFYEVKKGNTMYSLLRQLDMEADALVVLNPALEDGLKEGMILKVPKGAAGAITNGMNVSVSENGAKASLLDSLSDFSVKNVAVMLPFGLKRATVDTSDIKKNLLKNDRVLRLSLDFYSGVLMAVEAAKGKGISTNLSVYDTDYVRSDGKATNARKVEDIITSNNFNDVNVVIGPLLGSNVDRASSVLARRNIPLISPLTQRISGGSNVFQSRPSDAILRNRMLEYLKKHGKGKNIVIIADSKNATSKSKLKMLFPNAKEVNPRSGDKGLYLYPDDIPTQISETEENWVLLETNDLPLISNVTTSLNTQVATKKVKLFTTNRGNAYDSDEIQHMHLMNLNFHFPSMDREYGKDADEFISAYEDAYGVTPNRNAIRGYDIMYDTLLRLAYGEDLYNAAASGLETDYIENKFRYAKKPSGGFYNNAVYLMEYAQNLKLKEVIEETEDIED